MRRNIGIALVALAGMAASVSAGVSNGDIVYTSYNTNSIRLIEGPGVTNTLSTLVAYGGLPFSQGHIRLSGITQAGNGRFYVGNGPSLVSDPTWSTSAIFEVDDLFGTPSTNMTYLAGSPVQNPVDIVWNSGADHLLWVQNPFRWLGPLQPVEDGLYGSPVSSPSALQFFMETASGPRPFYEAGFYMAPDYQNPGSYYVTSLNGGTFVGAGDDTQGSTLWRFTPNYGNPALSTMSLVADLSTTNLGMPISELRGIASVPSQNALYVTNTWAHTGFGNAAPGVYKINLDGSGNFLSIVALNTSILQPEAIEYNPFTGKLVISSFNDLDSNGFPEEGRIYQMNLDGTGLEILVDGDFARDFYIIPTPGALALLGLSGLAAFRRRR